jgi:hypothetical protein
MIKLKHILYEIDLMYGDSGSDTLEDFYYNVKGKILPKKYDVVDDWIGFGQGGEHTRNLDGEAKKKYEKAQELMLVNADFKAIVDSKLELVASSGGYQLRMMKQGKDLIFHLIDPKAKYIYEYFIGIIKTEFGTRSYRFNPKKAFNLTCYQIHWSNVAKEKLGQGLGKLMYTMVYEYVTGLGAALVSDSMLFQGSQKMWFDYIPTIASFFGVVVEDIFFPIDKSEVNRDVMGSTVDTVVAMEHPPKEIRKVAYNVQGLSFKKGQYGMIRVRIGINAKIALKAGDSSKNFQYTMFSNLVDESPTMIGLIKKMERLGLCDTYDVTNRTGEPNDLKACVFSFDNANVIVKETGGRLVMVAI